RPLPARQPEPGGPRDRAARGDRPRCEGEPLLTASISTATAPAPVGAYPHARRVGELLFLSGVGPRTPGTNEIPGNRYGADGRLAGYDIEAQCRQVFANVRAVLEASGARWEDLVDV